MDSGASADSVDDSPILPQRSLIGLKYVHRSYSKQIDLTNSLSFDQFYPAVPRLSFATRFAHIFAHIFATGNEFQKYFSARRNSCDLT